eukprot:TRINITY_DN22552_c0_g2_i3.p1 TRINITY_DN22552_c0_g2~~TRINITY_DN22552_c0_g2_i3.p1  ORF type:complete len:189 (+),score=21.44 TRINITY_DN22552_c0_g2_i3:64-630(+)
MCIRDSIHIEDPAYVRNAITSFYSAFQEEGQYRVQFNSIGHSKRFLEDRCQCRRVLVVDDNEFNQLALATKFEARKYNVIKAFNGRSALEELERIFSDSNFLCKSRICQRISIVIMDVDMPEMNGLDATRAIREQQLKGVIPLFPIIGCSAFDTADDIRAGRSAGMIDYISKPVREARLDEVMRKFIF